MSGRGGQAAARSTKYKQTLISMKSGGILSFDFCWLCLSPHLTKSTFLFFAEDQRIRRLYMKILKMIRNGLAYVFAQDKKEKTCTNARSSPSQWIFVVGIVFVAIAILSGILAAVLPVFIERFYPDALISVTKISASTGAIFIGAFIPFYLKNKRDK